MPKGISIQRPDARWCTLDLLPHINIPAGSVERHLDCVPVQSLLVAVAVIMTAGVEMWRSDGQARCKRPAHMYRQNWWEGWVRTPEHEHRIPGCAPRWLVPILLAMSRAFVIAEPLHTHHPAFGKFPNCCLAVIQRIRVAACAIGFLCELASAVVVQNCIWGRRKPGSLAALHQSPLHFAGQRIHHELYVILQAVADVLSPGYKCLASATRC